MSPALEVARDDMIDRLLDGKTVERVNFAGILDHELDQSRAARTDELANLLLNAIAYARDEHTHGERRAVVEKWVRGMVERWVDAHPDQIRERAKELAHEEEG